MAARDVGSKSDKKEDKSSNTSFLWQADQEYPALYSDNTLFKSFHNLFSGPTICITKQSRDVVTCSGQRSINIRRSNGPDTFNFAFGLPFECHQVFPLAGNFIACANADGTRTTTRAALFDTQRLKLVTHVDLNGINLKQAALVGDKLVYVPQFKRISTQTLHALEIVELKKLGRTKAVAYCIPLDEKKYETTEEQEAETARVKRKQPRALTTISDNEFALISNRGDVIFFKINDDSQLEQTGRISPPGKYVGSLLIALSNGEVVHIEVAERDSGLYLHTFSYLGKNTDKNKWEWKRTVELLLPQAIDRHPHNGDHLFYLKDGKNCRLNLITLEGQVVASNLGKGNSSLNVIKSLCFDGNHLFAHFSGSQVMRYKVRALDQYKMLLLRLFNNSSMPLDMLDPILSFIFGTFKHETVGIQERQIEAPAEQTATQTSAASNNVGVDADNDNSDGQKRVFTR